MSDFDKKALLAKTNEYLAYIDQHKENVRLAWDELKAACKDVALVQRREVLNNMEWRIATHDDSKYSEEEFLAYRQHFYPVDGEEVDPKAFEEAWKTHYLGNDHHWQYWAAHDDFYGHVNNRICAYLEMICDWQAMGYTHGDSAPEYYRTHKSEIKLDSGWVAFVEEILDLLEQYMNRGEII